MTKYASFRLATVFVAFAVCALLMAAVRLYMERTAVRRTFLQMEQAKLVHYPISHPDNRAEFVKGVSPALLALLDQIKKPLPKQLSQYVSNSMPSRDYTAYEYTYLSVQNVVDINTDADIGSLQNGYFVFAEAAGNYVGVSLKDGKVYSAHGFDSVRSIDYEAENMMDFMRVSAQSWRDHE